MAISNTPHDGASLTLEKIREAIRALPPAPKFDTIAMSRKTGDAIAEQFSGLVPAVDPAAPLADLTTLYGIRVLTMPQAPRRPAVQISPDFPHVSEEFRAHWNAWALDRFGTVEDDRIFLVQSGVLRRISEAADLATMSALLSGAR